MLLTPIVSGETAIERQSSPVRRPAMLCRPHRIPLCAVIVALVIANPGLNAQSPVDQRIARVERGLIPPVVLKGETGKPATIAERMAYHGIPGMSMAVIEKWRARMGTCLRAARTRDRRTRHSRHAVPGGVGQQAGHCRGRGFARAARKVGPRWRRAPMVEGMDTCRSDHAAAVAQSHGGFDDLRLQRIYAGSSAAGRYADP